jgi:hypothetical protein
MYKLLLMIIMSLVFMTMYALQTDQELAMHTLFQGKHGLNAAAHAAAQQTDADKLAEGIFSIDEAKAQASALQYLQTNLRLNESNDPLPGTFFRSRVDVLVFEVINDNEIFPFTYTNAAIGYSVTLNKPGIVMIIELEFPRTYTVLGPIIWTIRSTAEMVY